VDPADPVDDDSLMRGFYWYHSSTHEVWPDRNFDPAAELTAETRRRMTAMCGVGAVERWAERQKAKALHLGTYEAAVENMFRRMRDQPGGSDQFYLYRVQLDPDCVIEPGIHREPTDWLGDAQLTDVCSPGSNVLRYVNVHEDRSSVSLAMEPSAVRAVQRIPIPRPCDASDPWIATAAQRLLVAASQPRTEPRDGHPRWRRRAESPLRSEIRVLELEVAEKLPSTLNERFSLDLSEESLADAPRTVPMRLVGMTRLVTNPEATLAALDAQPWQALISPEGVS
jgi:hypothetical protein